MHGAGRSDIGKALSVVERLDAAGLKPEALFADGDCMSHGPCPHRPSRTERQQQHAPFSPCYLRRKTLSGVHDARSMSGASPSHRSRGCRARDAVGDFRLEITPELRLRDQMHAVQQTREWKDRYKIRAEIEATNSELKRSHGIGRLRVRRWAKVCFAVACKVAACNIKRWARVYAALKAAHRLFALFWNYLDRPNWDVGFSKNDILSMVLRIRSFQKRRLFLRNPLLRCPLLPFLYCWPSTASGLIALPTSIGVNHPRNLDVPRFRVHFHLDEMTCPTNMGL